MLCYPNVCGNTDSAEPIHCPHLADKGLEFFKKNNYWGFCSIEYKGLDKDDPYFIEVTAGRTDWWLMCTTINGSNFPIAAYNDLTHSNIKPNNKAPQKKVVWQVTDRAIPVLFDKLLSKKWSFSKLIRYILKPKRYAVFDISDPKPFFYSLIFFIKKVYKKFS